MADNIKYTRASVLSDDTFEFSGRNPTKVAGLDGEEHAEARQEAARALQGLNELQRRGKGPVPAVSLSCGLQYLVDQVPLRTVSLVPPECDMFANKEETDAFRLVRRALKSADWLVWVVGTGDRHYVVVIVRLDPLPDSQKKMKREKREKRRVGAWAVVDPTGDHGSGARTRRVTDRLQEIMRAPRMLERVAGFEPQAERSIAVPQQPGHDEWSSGLRAFVLVDAVLQRLTDQLFRGGAAHDEPAVWAPVLRHFNSVRARNDMMTACAHQVRKHTEWAVRLALVPVRAPKGGKKAAAQAQAKKNRPAHEERFEPARGFGYSPDDVWSSDEAASDVEGSVPATPSSQGPPSRSPSPPPAPRKRKNFRVAEVAADDGAEAEPAPKRPKSGSTAPAGGSIEDPVVGVTRATQAPSDDKAPCGGDKATSPEPKTPAADATVTTGNDTAMSDAPAMSQLPTVDEDVSFFVLSPVPESPLSEEE